MLAFLFMDIDMPFVLIRLRKAKSKQKQTMLLFIFYDSSKSGEKSMNAANKYRLQRELQVEPDVRHK